MSTCDLQETTVSREVVHQASILRLERWQVALPNGNLAGRDIVVHHGAAAIVAVDDDGMVYLVDQYRNPFDRVTREIPAGKMDDDENDTLLCAQRELREETGLMADHWQLLTEVLPTPGYSTEHIGLYLATGLHKGKAHLDEDEFLHCTTMPLRDAVDAVMQGQLPDAKTALGILMAARILGC